MQDQMTGGGVCSMEQLAQQALGRGMQNAKPPGPTLEGLLSSILCLAEQISIEIGHLEQLYYQISGESTGGDMEVAEPQPGEPSLIERARAANAKLDSDLDRLRAVKDALQTRMFTTV